MTWPQIVMALYIGYSIIAAAVPAIRDRGLSSSQVTYQIFGALLVGVGLVLTLHAGGLW